MEALEITAEESSHNEFVAWMKNANQTSPSLYPDLVDKLGDPDAFPWRNWDICGGTFYCFTLMTTIGYGTFAPQTAGGKLFSCFFILVGIPFAAWTYGNLGNSLVSLCFHYLIKKRKSVVQQSWPTYEVADLDGLGVNKTEALLALEKSRLVIGKATIR